MFPLIVLAGGLATRLRPITETLPKSLIPINKTPFILHQLELFEKKGFRHVHFCLGYLGEMVEKVIMDSQYNEKLKISFSYDGDVLLGTGGAIKKIVNEMPEHFFITYGDSYLDIDYKDVQFYFETHKKNQLTGLMTVFKNEGKWDKSNVIFDGKEILNYSKKINDSNMKYIDYGVGILSGKNFVNYDAGKNFDLADVYSGLADQNNNLLGFEIYHRFFEIGSLKGISDISAHLKNR